MKQYRFVLKYNMGQAILQGHTMLAKSQYVATVHFDTGKPHVHIVANRLTMDGEMQDTHKCKERAKTAANIIAEKYGWTKAEG